MRKLDPLEPMDGVEGEDGRDPVRWMEPLEFLGDPREAEELLAIGQTVLSLTVLSLLEVRGVQVGKQKRDGLKEDQDWTQRSENWIHPLEALKRIPN